jgi:hypothetical protein
MSATGPSRHFAALPNLVVIGAYAAALTAKGPELAGPRSRTRMTCVADHWPDPRAVGMPRSLRPSAMAFSDVAPAVCSSSITGAISAARAAALRALASWPALRAFAVSFGFLL